MIISKLDKLISLSKVWTVSEALWVLRVYHGDYDELCWRGFWTTPYEIGVVENEDSHALEIKVKFLGGPTGNQECVGSLSMFVVDKVLQQWQQNKVNWSWLLRFDTTKAEHIKDQLEQIKPDSQRFLPGFEDERAGHCEPPFDYSQAERIVDYVQIGDEIYPILESGRQGCMVQRAGESISVNSLSAGTDSGGVHRWSSSGQIGGCKET